MKECKKGGGMNNLFIKGFSIDWNRIDDESYVREIEAIRTLDRLVLRRPMRNYMGKAL